MEPAEIERATKSAGSRAAGVHRRPRRPGRLRPRQQPDRRRFRSRSWPRSTATAARLTKWSQLGVKNTACAVRRDHPRQPPEQLRYLRLLPRGRARPTRASSSWARSIRAARRTWSRWSPARRARSATAAWPTSPPASRALAVAKKKGETAVAPTLETALDGTYPIARPLYLYTRGDADAAGQGVHRLDAQRRRAEDRAGHRLRAGSREVGAAGADWRCGARSRRGSGSLAEPLIEWTIRLCGWSAIFFVFAIFFFVFREGAPFLFGELDLGEFFTSINWRPDSRIRAQFGILALIAGTASVTLLAAVLSVPAGLGAAIFVSEFCPPRLREALKIVIELLAAIPSVVWGFIGYMVLNPLIIWATGRADRHQHPERRHHPGADERADHHVGRRGRPPGGAGHLSRGRACARRQPLADRLQGADAGRQERPAGGGPARHRPLGRRNDGRADGDRARRSRSRTACSIRCGR